MSEKETFSAQTFPQWFVDLEWFMRSCSDGDNPRNETLVINVDDDDNVDNDNNDNNDNDDEQAYKRILPKNRLLQEV